MTEPHTTGALARAVGTTCSSATSWCRATSSRCSAATTCASRSTPPACSCLRLIPLTVCSGDVGRLTAGRLANSEAKTCADVAVAKGVPREAVLRAAVERLAQHAMVSATVSTPKIRRLAKPKHR